ncbi:MAG: thioredoxin [Acidobacteria bacterium]|nr:thioredoxin [Acidobacteriota bacterium]
MEVRTLAGATIQVSDDDFEAKVLKSEGPVLVDFWADWCGPCHMVAPTLEEIAAEKKGSLVVAKLDVDSSPETARQYGIMSIPSMLLFVNGAEKRRIVGARGKAKILGEIEEFLATPGSSTAAG